MIDVDNDKNPDDKQWKLRKISDYLSKKGYSFFIQNSKTFGNYKIYLLTDKITSWEEYQALSKYANTMEEGLGDPQFQHIQSFVKGFISLHRGDKFFVMNGGGNPTPVTKTKSKAIGVAKQSQNGTQAVCGKMNIYLNMLKTAMLYKMTIKGKVLDIIARPNGTFTLVLADEVKSKGSYWINPEDGFMIHKAGGGKWTPREFFIDDKEQKQVYKVMTTIGNTDERIAMLYENNENVGIEELSIRKQKQNKVLEKSGAVKKISWKNGLRRVYWIWKQVRYYADKPKEILKLLNILKDSIFSSFFVFSKTSSIVQENNNNLIYKGQSEEERTKLHNKMIDQIQEWFWEAHAMKTKKKEPEKQTIDEMFKEYKKNIEEFREMKCA